MSSTSKDCSALYQKAMRLYKDKKYLESENYFARNIQKTKCCYSVYYYHWGLALYHQYKYKEAISKFTRSLQISPDCDDSLDYWGTALLMLGRYDEARIKFEEVVEIGYDSLFFETKCSLASFLAGEKQKAKEILLKNEKENSSEHFLGYCETFYNDLIKHLASRVEVVNDEEEFKIVLKNLHGIEWLLDSLRGMSL